MKDVFDSAHVSPSSILEADLCPPWCVAVPDSDQTFFYAVIAGECWLETDGIEAPVRLAAGDMATLVAGNRHLWRDALSTPVERAQAGFASMPAHNGGASGGKATRLLILSAPRNSNVFISVYPELVVIPGSETEAMARLRPLVRMIQLENLADRPGKQAFLKRLAELVVIELVRFALPRMIANGRNWLGGLGDRHIGQSIQLMHDQMGRPWSLNELAAAVGLSRAVYVERFTKLVGEPPHRYLRRVRMHRAAQDLERDDQAIIEVAEAAGYQSESSFNKAFAKEIGTTPGRYRSLHRRVSE